MYNVVFVKLFSFIQLRSQIL